MAHLSDYWDICSIFELLKMERKAGTLHAQRQAAIIYKLKKPALTLETIVAVTST